MKKLLDNEAVQAIIYFIKTVTQELINQILTYIPYIIGAIIVALLIAVGYITVKQAIRKLKKGSR